MERLILSGKVKVKASSEIGHSKIGIGFEKLDRGVFDPNKAYDKVAAIGVKWARLQTGWARCEKEKGVYDFAWLDELVDNFVKRGIIPWFNLSYGNPVYTERAIPVFGAVGCPPIGSEEEMTAWLNYVKALAIHFKGRVKDFEVWNEPDLKYSWKHNIDDPEADPGPSGTEYGLFCIATADAIHEVYSEAKVIGFGVAHIQGLDYMAEAFETGVLNHIDAISFHSYSSDDTVRTGRIQALRKLCIAYGKDIELIQGETGCQSRSDGSGALKGMAWTPLKQVKHQLRNMIIDLSENVGFTSYFSTLDMIEALRGLIGDKSSYLDYGYFGVLGADFDENGVSTGEYTPKPSYYSLSTLASVFAEDFEPADLPVVRRILPSKRVAGNDCSDTTVIMHGFKKPNGATALAYWNAVPILTNTYEGTISLNIRKLEGKVRLIELANGNVYDLPESMIEETAVGYLLKNIPITDTPMLLTFGDFADIQ